MSKEIIIEVDENGNCSVEGRGFVGSECDKFLSEINNSLGKTTSSRKKKEYHQRNMNKNRRKEVSR